LYTGLVYEGPGVARDIDRGLLDLLERDGFDSVAEAVGADL
jgi:dihydroorotate dehydrogenase